MNEAITIEEAMKLDICFYPFYFSLVSVVGSPSHIYIIALIENYARIILI